MRRSGDRRTKDRLTDGQRAFNRLQAGLRALVEQAIGHLANAWSLRRWQGLLYRIREVFRPPARWSAWAAGSTGSQREQASRTPSLDGSVAVRWRVVRVSRAANRPQRRAGQADGGDGEVHHRHATQVAEAAAVAGVQGEVAAGDADQGSD
jgi:hypothetical protein